MAKAKTPSPRYSLGRSESATGWGASAAPLEASAPGCGPGCPARPRLTLRGLWPWAALVSCGRGAGGSPVPKGHFEHAPSPSAEHPAHTATLGGPPSPWATRVDPGDIQGRTGHGRRSAALTSIPSALGPDSRPVVPECGPKISLRAPHSCHVDFLGLCLHGGVAQGPGWVRQSARAHLG